MIDILRYLHDLSPPVIHRDIKPSNIIRKPDGSYALIDFGGVQLVAAHRVGGTTVVGTTGYMPPEQLLGRAVPTSDLYGLAATTVHLIAGCSPSEMETTRWKLQFRHLTPISLRLAGCLERMLEPNHRDRYRDAREALEEISPQQKGRRNRVSTTDEGFGDFFVSGKFRFYDFTTHRGMGLSIGTTIFKGAVGVFFLYAAVNQVSVLIGLVVIAISWGLVV